MVNPNQQQMIKLDKLRSIVLDLMLDMEVWNETNTQVLKQIKLGVLRKNATQRHGVTRWKIGSDVTNLTPQMLRLSIFTLSCWTINGMLMQRLFCTMNTFMH